METGGVTDPFVEEPPATLSAVPRRPIPPKVGQACLVRIYPGGPGIGSRYVLSASSVVLGRDNDCNIHLDDQSVSRQHARIDPTTSGYLLVDLNSTNGTFVNDISLTERNLEDGDYICVGQYMFRYLDGGNVEAEYHEEIHRLTIIDALTDVYNKRYFLERLQRELARTDRHRRPLALLMIDVDRFKAVNDKLGHLAGDRLLRHLADEMKKNVRTEDLLARYGGEEFALLLVECTQDDAVEGAERLRRQIASHPLHFEGCQLEITVSIGVGHTDGTAMISAAEFIRQADEHLYQAKIQGRNQVVSPTVGQSCLPRELAPPILPISDPGDIWLHST